MSAPGSRSDAAPVLRLRILFGNRVMIGPGKAELLERIRDTGSISAAGRAMAMSYKRAWSLVEDMNAGFAEPLVESVRGGPGGGGARVTPAGEDVLRHYRAVVQAAELGAAGHLAALQDRLAGDMSDGK